MANPESHKPSEPQSTTAEKQSALSSFRTQLALDRTMLAWIRTTLTMASFGLGMIGFFRSLREHSPSPVNIRLHEGAIRMGVMLVILGILATIAAGVSNWFSVRRLIRDEPPALRQWPLTITVGFLFVLISLGGLWAVFPW